MAKIYAGEGEHRSNRWSVLVRINVDTDLESTIFAHVDQISFMRDEREVLFSLSAVFKIVEVYKDVDGNRWVVCLEATDEGRENFAEYGRLLRHDAEETNIHVTFGSLIVSMGKYEKACAYFDTLAKRLPAGDIDLQGAIRQRHGRALFFMGNYQKSFEIISEGLDLYRRADVSTENSGYLRLQFNLANVYMFTGRLDDALELYEKVLNHQQKIFKSDHRHIAESFCGISWAHQRKQNYNLALRYCERGLDIFQRTLPSNHPTILKALVSLGGLLETSGQWDAAYDELKQALDTCRRFLPDDHPYIADLLRYVGGIHVNRGDIDIAFDYYQRVLQIREKNFPNGHIMIASLLTIIADLHRLRKEFEQAIVLHEHSDELRAQLSPPGTPIHKHVFGLIYLDRGDTPKAIECFQLTYEIRIKESGKQSAAAHRTLSCLATAYSHHGDLELSLKTFEEVLFEQQQSFREGHPDIGVTLHHMGSNFRRMKNDARAMGCYRESVKVLKRFMGRTHFEVTSVLKKIQELDQEEQTL